MRRVYPLPFADGEDDSRVVLAKLDPVCRPLAERVLGRRGRLAATQITPAPAEVRWVWFEAESAGGDTGAELSNGAMIWIGPGGHLQRSIVVPSTGIYQLWVRKFWNPQAFRWRVGAADAWKDSPAQTLSDLVLLAGNPGRRVGWANVGAVSLLTGTHTFRLEVPAADPNPTAYDCFLLTRDPFNPRGKLKPDEVFQVTQPGWFAFQPAPDPYGFSPIDLRYLNERQAGDHGFVRVDFVTNGTPESRILDLSPYLDRARKQVRSHSGELEWDWGTGRFTINAPAAQGVSGFLSAFGPVELDGVRIQSAMDYGAVVLVAMDGQPIASSAKMLLQVASEEVPLRWATSAPSGVRTITDRGTVPLLVKSLGGTVQLKRTDAAALTVTPLDFNGTRLSGPPMAAADFVLRTDAPYYLIEE